MELVKALQHPEEILALLKFRIFGCSTTNSKCDLTLLEEDMRTCYNFLRKTSRSFYAVIMALDDDLRYAVCIFYLVLRALDTVEDDMTINVPEKLILLKTFHEKLYLPGWSYDKSQEKDREVLERFHIISSQFRKLSPIFQSVIVDCCRDMGNGMAIFLNRTIGSYGEWDEYCHHVAGIVGIGLSKLFTASKLEDDVVGADERTANSMGLFLQKTNIIRDYYDDVKQNRLFWPRQAWSKYADHLTEFSQKHCISGGINCLNELITNALQHIPDVILYLGRIRNQSVFNFCAIPQIMAIATLERCYNNLEIFHKNVKIRRSEAVLLMSGGTNLAAVKQFLMRYGEELALARPAPVRSQSNLPEKEQNILVASHRQTKITWEIHEIVKRICIPAQFARSFRSTGEFKRMIQTRLIRRQCLWMHWVFLSMQEVSRAR